MEKATLVVKIGGALISENGAPESFWQSVRKASTDARVVVVHGGGPHATRVARMIGHEPHFVHGRRVTSDLDLEIVQWTMRGALNSRMVAQAFQFGLRAVGLCGADDGLLRVHRRPPWEIDGEKIDFGWVGDVDAVDTEVIEVLLSADRLPIIAPMGIDRGGLLYNVNADTVAMKIAAALMATELVMVTDSGGVRSNPNDALSIKKTVDPSTINRGVIEGWITAGMRAKLESAIGALSSGVQAVRIVGPSDLGNPEAGTRILRP